MTRKSTLSPESVAVITYIKEHGTSTAAALRPHFQDMSRTQLLKRLGNLVDLGWLDFTWDTAGDKAWFLRASARATPVRTVADKVPRNTRQDAPGIPVAAPRRVDVMSGNYVPPRGPALRPGALDFRARPSVGYRC